MDTYYDQISEGYEELHREEQLKKIEIIKQTLSGLNLEIKKTDKLLDVGCGTGLTTEPWQCKRHGIDPAKQLLARARNKEKIEYKFALAENIPYSDNQFDIVISITAIQNFKDIKKGLEEINRVGKGSFILTFLKKSSKKDIIEKYIEEMFNIMKKTEEEKDIIYIAKTKTFKSNSKTQR